MAKILVDCTNGVSGDMLVGALIDLGVNREKLLDCLESLRLDSKIEISTLHKKSFSVTDFDVIMPNDCYDHDMNFLYKDKKVSFKFDQKRRLKDIKILLQNSKFSQKVCSLAIKIFEIVAESEAKAHNIAKDQVVFHEAGAMDSIVDIVSFAFCLEDLKIAEVFAVNLREGQGQINSRVGLLPIPTPAVKNITEKFGIKLEKVALPYELITPTGIAALASVAKFQMPEIAKVEGVGFGNGKRNYQDTDGILEIKKFV